MADCFISRLCVQVDGVALVQGVQEGREMNAPPLPLEERRQSERISSAATSENTEEFGSLLFFFFSFCLSSSGGRGEKTTHPTTRERNSLSSWTSSPVISSHKVSRIWERLLSFSKRPKRLTLEAFSVLNLKNKKKQKQEDAAGERGKELNSVLDWVFPSMLVEK